MGPTTVHDNSPDKISNKIFPKSLGIILLANLYSCARDLCADSEDEIMSSDDATQLIVDHFYKKGPLSVVSVVFAQLQNLLATRCDERGSNLPFEGRFDALLSRLTCRGSSVASSDAMAALLLLPNSNVDGSQRIAILAAVAPKSIGLCPWSSTDEFIEAVKYESIATVLRQCDCNATPTGQPESYRWIHRSHKRPTSIIEIAS